MDIQIDGSLLPTDGYTLVGVSTVADVGFYCRPLPYAQTKQHFTVARDDLLSHPHCKVIPQLWFAKPTQKPYIKDSVGSEIRFQYLSPISPPSMEMSIHHKSRYDTSGSTGSLLTSLNRNSIMSNLHTSTHKHRYRTHSSAPKSIPRCQSVLARLDRSTGH